MNGRSSRTTEAPLQARRVEFEQRFRASVVASLAVHVGVLLASIVWPALLSTRPLSPTVLPVSVVQLPQRPPAPAEAAAPPAEAAAEPAPVVTRPEPVPRTLEQLRRARDEARRLRQEEAERQRREAEQRRQREEQERRRREEEEARRRPQKAARRDSSPAPQRAARQEISFTGTESGQRGFTVEEFPFSYYVLRIRDLVGERWDPPPRGAFGRERRASVFFRIDRSGRLAVPPRIETGSGDTLFDQAALRAIASAAPFPPLPREYQGQSLGVRFAFIQE